MKSFIFRIRFNTSFGRVTAIHNIRMYVFFIYFFLCTVCAIFSVCVLRKGLLEGTAIPRPESVEIRKKKTITSNPNSCESWSNERDRPRRGSTIHNYKMRGLTIRSRYRITQFFICFFFFFFYLVSANVISYENKKYTTKCRVRKNR